MRSLLISEDQKDENTLDYKYVNAKCGKSNGTYCGLFVWYLRQRFIGKKTILEIMRSLLISEDQKDENTLDYKYVNAKCGKSNGTYCGTRSFVD